MSPAGLEGEVTLAPSKPVGSVRTHPTEPDRHHGLGRVWIPVDPTVGLARVRAMKKLLLLVVMIALAGVAPRQLTSS